MRIAIVTESFLPQVNGVTNSVMRIVDHLESRGDEALIIAPPGGPARYRHADVICTPALPLPVVNSIQLGMPTGVVNRALSDFRPDLVHLADPTFLGARAAYAARTLKVPAVAVFHTDIAGFADSYGLRLLVGTAWRWIRHVHGLADITLAPTEVTAELLRAHDVPRIKLWPRGVDIEAFDPAHRSASLRESLAPHGELLVGYVGRLAPEKSLHRLSVISAMPGVRLVIVGEGPSGPELRRALPNAVFLGELRGKELSAAYASLDVFVHTGAHETFCQAVQEALASGLPVIAPNAGGPRNLVAHGSTGYLLEPFDDSKFKAELVEAVRALTDRNTRAEFAAKARDSVQGRTWPAVCAQLMDYYQAVLS